MDNADALFLRNAIADRLAVHALRHNGPTRGTLTYAEVEEVSEAFGVLTAWTIATFVEGIIPDITPRYDIGEHLNPKATQSRLQVLAPTIDDDGYMCDCGASAMIDIVSLPGEWFTRVTFTNGILWTADLVPTFSCYHHLPTTPLIDRHEDQVGLVWEAYLDSLRSHQLPANMTRTPALSGLIKRRIQTFGLDDTLGAVTNWTLSEWHLANRACDLKVILKESNIRKFNLMAQERVGVDTTGGVTW